MREIWSAIELVSREACPLCAAPAEGPILTRRWDGLPVRRCMNCALLFIDPVPNEAALMRCYAPEYFERSDTSRRIGPGRDYCASAEEIESGNVKGHAQIAGNFELAGKAVLEVGCATGVLLQSLRKYQPSALVGIDIAGQQIGYGRERFGLDLRCTKLEDANFGPAQFDLIIMLDVLEHAWNTSRFFSAAAHCLRPGGNIFVRTPNADSYWLAKRRWTYLHCGLEHVAYLSKASLALLANKHGMLIERTETEGWPASSPYIDRGRLARFLCEPVELLTNRIKRRRFTNSSDSGCGLDMSAVLRKKPETIGG